MKNRIKILLVFATLMITVFVLNLAFHLINAPSDFYFYLGLFLIAILFAAVPTLLSFILKPRKGKSHEKVVAEKTAATPTTASDTSSERVCDSDRPGTRRD